MGRGQRVRGGHAGLRRPEHDLAGAARRRPRPGPLLAGRQVNAVYPNGDGARDFGTCTARYPEWLWRYYISTGDRHHGAALYPSVSQAVDWLWSARQAGTGLLYGLADTDNGDPVYGYDLSVAADTASNVLAVNAMRRVAQFAGVAGDTAPAQTWQTRAAQLAAAVNAALRRPDGIYVDGVDADGAQSTTPRRRPTRWRSPTAWCRPPTWRPSGAYVASLGIDVGPNHGLELLRGLAAAGMPEAMVHLLTDTSIPGWAHIVAAGGTFTWEVWNRATSSGTPCRTAGAPPRWWPCRRPCSGSTLGEPDADGTVHAVVAPPSAGLDRAEGSVPTVAGPLHVAWQRRSKGMTMALTVPANAAATVRLPASAPRRACARAARLRHDAPGVTVVSAADGVVVLSVGSGTYRFTSADVSAGRRCATNCRRCPTEASAR